MVTRDIPFTEWPAFFERFNRQHAGQLVNLDSPGVSTEPQDELTAWPLLQIVSEAPAERTIHVMVGEQSSSLVEVISSVTHVTLQQAVGGSVAVLTIESADGQRTVLELHPQFEHRKVKGQKSKGKGLAGR
jgi:hypothetical protein